MFPFTSKTKVMRAVLPCEIAHDLSCAGVHCFWNCRLMSHAKEWRVENENVGTSGSEASRWSWTVLHRHGLQNIVQVAVRKPQIADEAGSQNRSDSRLELTSLRACSGPVGRHCYRAAGRSDGVIKIQARAQEGRMPAADIAVKTHRNQVEIERAALNDIEFRKDRVVIRNGKDAILIVMFEIGEPKQTVFNKWAAKAEPGLAPREKRIWIFRIPLQSRVRRQVVVPVVEEGCAMQRIAAPPGNDVDRAASGRARC